MSRHVSIRYSAVRGTAAGLGHTGAGQTVIADRPPGVAGGRGLGFNGAELLAAALGGSFWNDLHHVAEANDMSLTVAEVLAEVELAGTPPRVVRAKLAARLSGAPDETLRAVFDTARQATTIANSIGDAIPVAFERLPEGEAP